MKGELQILSRFIVKQFGQDTQGLSGTGAGSVRVAELEPPFTELGRAGRRFVASPGVVANAVAPVTDMPTTASMYAVYNGEPASGKSYLIEALSGYLASGTAAVGATIICGVTTGAQAAVPAAGTGVLVKSASGSALGTRAVYASGLALTNAPAWFPIGGNGQSAGTTPGLGGYPLMLPPGMFIVPPGYCFAMHVLSGAGTSAKYSLGCIWSELELDLE